MENSPVYPSKPRAAKKPGGAPASPAIPGRTLTRLAQVFKMLADESRLTILLALARERELNVTSLCELLDTTQPAVSHHLTMMRMAGLVGFRRAGKHNFYRIESGALSALLEQFFTALGNPNQQIDLEDFSVSFQRR